MTAITLSQRHEILFRPYFPWLVLNVTVLLSLAVGLLTSAFLLNDPRWLVGTGLLTVIALVIILKYMAHAIIITGASLICRRGIIRVYELTIPISRIDYEIHQTLPGRLLGYGTVRIYLHGTTISLHHIASIRALQAEIARRQTEILMAPNNWRIGMWR
jgi:uncharacterized membrane protein YdbT with pleckstrin-like domain